MVVLVQLGHTIAITMACGCASSTWTYYSYYYGCHRPVHHLKPAVLTVPSMQHDKMAMTVMSIQTLKLHLNHPKDFS